MTVVERAALLGLLLAATLGLARAGEFNGVLPMGPRLLALANGCRLLGVGPSGSETQVRLGECRGEAGELTGADAAPFQRVRWRADGADGMLILIATAAGRVIAQPTGDSGSLLICASTCASAQPAAAASLSPPNAGGAPAPVAAPDAAAAPTANRLLEVGGQNLSLPLAGIDLETFIDRSIGYVPSTDLVRDGLPHFGSVRDDWLGRPRTHQGIDIYVDDRDVLAVADGAVIQAGPGRRSGHYLKLSHGNGIATTYVHLARLSVGKGARVRRGQVIGRIDGPAGNAVEPQLHFELEVDGTKRDPYDYVLRTAGLAPALRAKILLYREKLKQAAELRALLIR